MKQWTMRVLLGAAIAFLAVYCGDWALYNLRGSPKASVVVNSYVTIPEKGNKLEYDYQGALDVQCSISLFGQEGLSPCWRLRRNTNQGMTPQ